MNIYTNAYVYKYILDFWSIKRYLLAKLIENTIFNEHPVAQLESGQKV